MYRLVLLLLMANMMELTKELLTDYLLSDPIIDDYKFTLKDGIDMFGLNTLDNTDVIVLMNSGVIVHIPLKLITNYNKN